MLIPWNDALHWIRDNGGVSVELKSLSGSEMCIYNDVLAWMRCIDETTRLVFDDE